MLAVSNLVNNGTINYSGGVLSIGGTPTTAGVINIGPHDSLTDDGVLNVGTAATPGIVNTAGKVLIGSAGTLNLVGNGKFAQTGGVTDVDGTLIAPTTTVSVGALTGAGTIQGNVTEDLGYLQAGNPAGTLVIAGNLTFSNSLVGEDIESATNFGVLDVTGTLTLSDLDLLAAFGSSQFTPTDDEIFDIVNAGSITGTFLNPYAPFADGAFRIELSSTGCSSGSACIDLVWDGRGGHTAATEPSSVVLLGAGILALALIHLSRHIRLPESR